LKRLETFGFSLSLFSPTPFRGKAFHWSGRQASAFPPAEFPFPGPFERPGSGLGAGLFFFSRRPFLERRGRCDPGGLSPSRRRKNFLNVYAGPRASRDYLFPPLFFWEAFLRDVKGIDLSPCFFGRLLFFFSFPHLFVFPLSQKKLFWIT